MFKLLIASFALVASTSAYAIDKRQYTGQHSGDGTWYNTGLGACGITSVDTDFIVAVNGNLFNNYPGFTPGSNPNLNAICGKNVTATYGTKRVTATVLDVCGGCKEFDLDFSPAAFNTLADPGLGRIHITWSWD